jgi:hypothetical protein
MSTRAYVIYDARVVFTVVLERDVIESAPASDRRAGPRGPALATVKYTLMHLAPEDESGSLTPTANGQ